MSVSWSATAGSFVSNGLFIAPSTSVPTNLTVTATSIADPTKSATAAVRVNPALQIITTSLPQGQEGDAYDEAFAANGGTPPYHWNISAGAGPAGIVLQANGDFQGTPTGAGTFNFTVVVTDATNVTASRGFSVIVDEPSVANSIPLTYSARTDDCVTGEEPGCLPGATTGEAGSAMSFSFRNSDSVPFDDVTSGNANMGSAGVDPDFNSYLVMATDGSTGAKCLGSTGWPSWNMGSDGEWDAFSRDGSLLLAHTDTGNACILFLNRTAIHAQTCGTAAPACASLTRGTVALTPIGTAGPLDTYHLAAGGSWNFSRVPGEANVLYELEKPPTKVDRVVICPDGASSPNCSDWSGPGPLLRTVYQDFTSESGSAALPPRYVPAGWTSDFQTANQGAVAYGMGGGQDWMASWTPIVTETFLYPQTNKPSGTKGYQATAVRGPTGSTEPNFAVSCPALGNICTDGGVAWTNIGDIGGQGPGFDVIGYRPSQGSWRLNTRIGKIYRGTGNTAPAGYITTNDNIACTRAANGGTITYPCALPDRFTLHGAGQAQNDRYVIMSPTGGEYPNAPGSWNSGTLSGQTSNATWSYGFGGGNGGYSGSITYKAHDVVANGGCYFTALTSTTGHAPPACNPAIVTENAYWQETEAYPLDYYFDIATTNLGPCTDFRHCNGHQAQGYTEKVYGSRYASALLADPVDNGELNPGMTMLTTALPCDFHGTWRQGGILDDTPIGVINTCVPAWTTAYTKAGYGEIDAVRSDGSGTMYRFGHDYNTGSSIFFQDQNNIGVFSYLGDLIAFGTDMMGKRGSRLSANMTCDNKRGMYKPTAGLDLKVGDTVYPVTDNPGHYIYQAITAGITSGEEPDEGWSQTYPNDGKEQSWGAASVDNIGSNGCRSDIVILDALSAHPEP